MNYFIADSHTDFMTAIKNKLGRQRYIKQCVRCGVNLISCAIFTTETNFSVNDIKNFKTELDTLSQKYKIKLLLSIEDLGFIKTHTELMQLIELKPFSIGLTWNYLNQYGGGASTSQGLTSLGKRIVEMLEQNNILIDTAHLSRRSFDEFVNITTLPIYNSHSNIYKIYPHQRNLTDYQIRQIVNSGGYLGITMYEKFISNNPISSLDIANQFKYLISKFGTNSFGFGSDLWGFDLKRSPTDIKSYRNFSNITDYFYNMGYDDSVIEKIMYKNFTEFSKKIF